MATAAVTPDNQTVDVNTTAPDPVAALGSEDTSLLQPPMQPQMPSSTVVNPGSSDGLDAQQQAHHGMLYNLLNEVGTALGGKNSYTVERGDDGKMNITPHESSMPDKWKRIAVAAIRGGLASAANGGTGPGNLSRAVGAGGAAGYQGANSDRQGQIDQANDDFNKKQQTTLFNANMALSQQRLHEATFGNMRDGVQFDQAQADRANGIAATMQNLPTKPVDLGVHKDVMDVASATAANPELMTAHTDGRIYSEPEYDENHQPIGMHSWLIDKDAGERMNPTPVTQRYWGVDDKGQGVIKTRTIPANSMKMKDIMLSSQQGELGIATGAAAAHKQKQEDKKEASEAGLRTAEASKDYAEGAKARGEAAAATPGDANSGTSMQQQAQMMVEGRLAPSQLSKRAKTYNELLPLANQYSMQKYGKPFDAETSETRYRTRQKTTEAYATGTEGNQVTSLNQFLGHTENLANTVDQLRNTNSPLLNMPIKALRKAMGDARYAEIEPQIAAVRTEHANFLNNNHALHAEDIRDNGEMMNDNMSLAQLEGAAKGFAHTAVVRGGALNDKHRRIMGEDVPDMLNDTSKRVIRNLGMDASGRQFLGTAYAPASSQPQQQAAPQSGGSPTPAAGGFDWNAHPKAN